MTNQLAFRCDVDESAGVADRVEAARALARAHVDESRRLGELADRARARTTDPATSHEAAASIAPEDLRASQRFVLDVFRRYSPHRFCDESLIVHYGYALKARHVVAAQSDSGIRTRRRELVDAGYLRDSGEKVVLPSGRRSIVWELA